MEMMIKKKKICKQDAREKRTAIISKCCFVFSDPCLVQYCMKGRECVLLNGEPQCVCQKQCPPHRRIVCGSDGHIYPNHCELHRAACLSSTAITVQRGIHCIKRGNFNYLTTRNE